MTPIEKAQATIAAKREAGEVERLDPFAKLAKLAAKPTNRKLAIVAMCCTCMGGGPGLPVPRREIRECTAPRCPLYAVRPYQARQP